MTKIVFTNGCFDLLHPGHVDLLTRAKALGDRLIVGINSDASVRSIKGPNRPVQSADARRAVLLALKPVDEVVVFDELTPERVISEIKPDVLVKGGDWKIQEVVGGDYVKANGGEVHTLPLVEGFSTTTMIEASADRQSETELPDDFVKSSFSEHVATLRRLTEVGLDAVRKCGDLIVTTFKAGNKVLVCGNGGSAADSQHIAAEFVGRYETERRSLPAIALTTDTSALTAISNDYNFERVFARQVESLAAEGDCLIAISTSGSSPNVLAAVMEARKKGVKVVGLAGAGGKKLASLSDAAVLVPSKRTARIQEAHITIAHVWCEMVDRWIVGEQTDIRDRELQ
jgi:D-sedoheptulose 7-phosphate isomerase